MNELDIGHKLQLLGAHLELVNEEVDESAPHVVVVVVVELLHGPHTPAGENSKHSPQTNQRSQLTLHRHLLQAGAGVVTQDRQLLHQDLHTVLLHHGGELCRGPPASQGQHAGGAVTSGAGGGGGCGGLHCRVGGGGSLHL